MRGAAAAHLPGHAIISHMIQILEENPLLLLFLVAAVGYPLGRIRVGGASLGVAAVLFVGLAFGSLDPDLSIPEPVYQLGLALFVYTIGLASGSLFFSSLRGKGLQYNLLIAGGLIFAAAVAGLAHLLLGISAPYAAGMYSGGTTNTPALAGAIEHIAARGLSEPALSEPVIAYSLTYPMGVLGMILTIYVFQRAWKINYAEELRSTPEYNTGLDPLQSRTIYVRRAPEGNVAQMVSQNRWNVVFGRVRSDGDFGVVTGQTSLKTGDLVTLVGTEEALDEVTRALGETSTREHLEFDFSRYDRKRFVISSAQASGRKLSDLDITGRYGAIITRIRRGDMELLPHGETVLMPGDVIRAVVPYNQIEGLTRLLGDSYRAVSEIDILTFSLGLALGLLLGMVPMPLPGGVTLRLGLAGGPLIVSLILGALGRTGPLLWAIPLGANLTLRQFGLIIFLAGIGVRAGYAFISTLLQGSGLIILAAGAAVTVLTSIFVLLVGRLLMKAPMGLLIGLLSGLQTQPAVLGFSLEQTNDEMPNIGYATVFPVAMILKIVLAQVLLIILL